MMDFTAMVQSLKMGADSGENAVTYNINSGYRTVRLIESVQLLTVTPVHFGTGMSPVKLAIVRFGVAAQIKGTE